MHSVQQSPGALGGAKVRERGHGSGGVCAAWGAGQFRRVNVRLFRVADCAEKSVISAQIQNLSIKIPGRKFSLPGINI